MTQERSDANDSPAEMQDYAAMTEESNFGEIKVKNSVVATIVKLATLEVPGVVAVAGGGVFDEITGIFSKRDTGIGITIEQDENDNYNIAVRVILMFGYELAKTAFDVQNAVREQVGKMTNKKVAKVDVFIDGVRMPESQKEKLGKEAAEEEEFAST